MQQIPPLYACALVSPHSELVCRERCVLVVWAQSASAEKVQG